ncbi:hypothetical protein [Streptomyces sp. NPDC026673]|uniref:hypothetical protein n=1 Tax=Streptomyces sp. NPDC026673 TaxID=3155724 RepID=UPI0033ED550F
MFEDDPKTEESAGTIALDSLNVSVLREHRARQLAERDGWNRKVAEDAVDWQDTGKVFTGPDGTWLHPAKVSGEFRRIHRRADLPPINLRDLRHLAATLVHAGGGDIHAVKATLRHSTIRLTSDTYTELLEETDRAMAERAAGRDVLEVSRPRIGRRRSEAHGHPHRHVVARRETPRLAHGVLQRQQIAAVLGEE